MTPPTQHSTRSRPRPVTLAAAAAMTGLLVLTQPGAAIAAEKAGTDENRTTVLNPTISRTDGTVRYSVAGLAGGGIQLSFVHVPNEVAGEKSGRQETQSKEFTVTVDAAAIATETVTDDDGGTVVPAAVDTSDNASDDDSADEEADEEADKTADEDGDSTKTASARDTGAIVKQDVTDDSTKVTLSADTEGVATVWVLPQQAPAAADPDDQSWVTRTWHLLVDKITGDSSGQNDEKDSNEDSGQDDTADAEPTAAPTSSPTSSPTSDPTSDPTSSSSSTPSSSSSSLSSTATGGADQDDEDATGEGDTCVVTQDQLTVSARDGGDGTVNAPLEDGPSAAPTFSEEVRKKAAQQEPGSDCGEGTSDDATGDDDSASDKPDEDDVTEVSDTATSSGTSSGGGKVEVAAGDWLSGISGKRPAAEKLRGVPAEVATTWTDFSGDADQLNPGAEFGPDKWDKSLIIAMPPFPEGSSWEATAAGQNDEYLRHAFSTLKSKWAGRDGTAYVEYSYEANGYWMAWPVKAGQEDAWAKAFERARSIQQTEFPDARLGVRLNHESNGYDGDSHDLLQAVKGSIDFIGTSYYNAYPPVATAEEFEQRAQMLDGGGGPKGISTWLAAAKAIGLPIEVGEWAESAKDGDSSAFIDGMHDTFSSNAGPGAGQVFAESYFNVDKDNDNWRINSGKVPESAKRYAEKFSDVGGK